MITDLLWMATGLEKLATKGQSWDGEAGLGWIVYKESSLRRLARERKQRGWAPLIDSSTDLEYTARQGIGLWENALQGKGK